MTVQRLIRFLDPSGTPHYGEPLLPPGADLLHTTHARELTGNIFDSATPTSQVLRVQTLLTPLPPSQTRTVRCLGLNYANHAKESRMPLPTTPILFYKPATSLSTPTSPILIPELAQHPPGLDYECELVIVIGKDGRDIPASDALDYVLGYSVGNDVSHRHLQLQSGGGQWSLGKGFDTWAPWGPGIVSTEAIKDPQGLRIETVVNGEVRQKSSTADMIFSVKETVAFLSKGTTLRQGDLIFTGTPEGVAMGGEKGKERWLKDGDSVEVRLEGVGTCQNVVKFEGAGQPKL